MPIVNFTPDWSSNVLSGDTYRRRPQHSVEGGHVAHPVFGLDDAELRAALAGALRREALEQLLLVPDDQQPVPAPG